MKTKIKTTKEGRYYIKTVDLLMDDDIKKVIRKLVQSPVVKDIKRTKTDMVSV
jgi:hypothetical protein